MVWFHWRTTCKIVFSSKGRNESNFTFVIEQEKRFVVIACCRRALTIDRYLAKPRPDLQVRKTTGDKKQPVFGRCLVTLTLEVSSGSCSEICGVSPIIRNQRHYPLCYPWFVFMLTPISGYSYTCSMFY